MHTPAAQAGSRRHSSITGRGCQRASLLLGGFLAALTSGSPVLADDSEIFVRTGDDPVQPNLLVIVDTSGSMDELVTTRAPYDSRHTYAGACGSAMLYFRTGAGTPPGCDAAAQLPIAINRCRAATDALAGPAGFWTGRLAQWNAHEGRWGSIRTGESEAPLECERGALQQIDASRLDIHTLYSANWLNWYHSAPDVIATTRLAIVQNAIASIARSVEGVRIGLMRFSNTAGSAGDRAEGGMVTHAIADLAATRDQVVEGIHSYTAQGLAPFSETLYEAGQYLAGRPVDYGLRATADGSTPLPSALAARQPEAPALYHSPITHPCQRSYVVLLAGSEPSEDNGADSRIANLPQFPTLVGPDCDGSGPGRCLDDMADYLHEADLSDLPGRQNAVTYTIGFGPGTEGSPPLARTAARGGGRAFSARDATGLTAALADVVGDALRAASAFATPAVTLDAFNRTEHVNELYVPVFQPGTTLHWAGNLRKYGLRGGRIVDQYGAEAIDRATGLIREGSRDDWADGPDVGRVDAGGALDRLPAPGERRLLTWLGANPPPGSAALLEPFATTDARLTDALLGTGAGLTREQLIAWAHGRDAGDRDGDGDTLEALPFMGDALHAHPAVVTYGGSASAPDARDAVIFAPTNDGYLHALDARSGRELWAFLPRELLHRLAGLYHNPAVAARTYGLDGDLRVLKFDANQDGIVAAAQGDRVWLFFGMRRGGHHYYALDVTDRDRPRLKWSLGPGELPGIGESWSPPAITRVRVGGAVQNGEHLVLIFGGGYDSSHENPAYATDRSGHRVYMVDASSGALLWYAGGPAGTGAPDLPLSRMTHSIPGRTNVIDLDGDGFADRMYAADLGGRVWRFDIHNGHERDTLVTGGVLAQLGAGDDPVPDIRRHRRFYYAPDVALMQRRGAEPYFNLAIGSGYRGHPLHTGTRDRFYSIRDRSPFTRLDQASYDALAPIRESDLVDVTDSITTVSVPASARGWRLELRLNGGWVGEKVLAEALTVNGVVLFPTYQPMPPTARDPCLPASGVNRVYALSVDTGRPAIDFDDDRTITLLDVSTRLTQTGIAGEIGLALENPTDQRPGAGGRPDERADTGTDERDTLGRRAVCLVGVEVLRKCVLPGGVVRTFWLRTSGDDTG